MMSVATASLETRKKIICRSIEGQHTEKRDREIW